MAWGKNPWANKGSPLAPRNQWLWGKNGEDGELDLVIDYAKMGEKRRLVYKFAKLAWKIVKMPFSSLITSLKKYCINNAPGSTEILKEFELKIGFGIFFLMYACLVKIYVYIGKSSFKSIKKFKW